VKAVPTVRDSLEIAGATIAVEESPIERVPVAIDVPEAMAQVRAQRFAAWATAGDDRPAPDAMVAVWAPVAEAAPAVVMTMVAAA
jgi:hypothetical protein